MSIAQDQRNGEPLNKRLEEWDDDELFISLRSKCSMQEAQHALHNASGNIWDALDIIATTRNLALKMDDGILTFETFEALSKQPKLYRPESDVRRSYENRVRA